ncbi:hypothetical protein L1D34_15205 [Vibrio mediterranei]|uniref:hypothetical protein n=1 Tax=Vibrio mediterranei TaxID=689 RepID=UPI001EFECE7D|nr:hypothetical protein [Vibrio mediterranei]MCG9626187.1 hypothetical protein [Vibrio mediterranei]
MESNKRNEGTLAALLKNGNTFEAPFGGFIKGEHLIRLRRVKLLHVRFFCEDEDAMTPSYQIPKDHYLVGIYLEKKRYMLVAGGQPQHYFYKNAEIESSNKVCRLF